MALQQDELRRTSAVLEAAVRSTSLAQFMSQTLGALDEHLGFSSSAFMLAVGEAPSPGRRAFAGVKHGSPPYVLEEYFERWADLDPLASEAARSSYARRGWATVADAYPSLEPGRRRFVDDFLRRVRQPGQLSFRLPAGWTDGYLTLMGPEDYSADERDLLAHVVTPLTALLREWLPRGITGLSARESQVAELVALGFTNAQIAAVLHIEEDTVKKHVSHALARLGLHGRPSLAAAWATGRLMEAPPVMADIEDDRIVDARDQDHART